MKGMSHSSMSRTVRHAMGKKPKRKGKQTGSPKGGFGSGSSTKRQRMLFA